MRLLSTFLVVLLLIAFASSKVFIDLQATTCTSAELNIPKIEVGGACTGSATCRLGLYCDATSKKCTEPVVLKIGDSCSAFVPGTSQSICPVGSYCPAATQKCTLPGNNGDVCPGGLSALLEPQCGARASCVGGKCMQYGSAKEGDSCSLTSLFVCGDGLYCKVDAGKCTKRIGVGQSCANPVDIEGCVTDAYCRGGICTKRVGENEDCSAAGSVCQTGFICSSAKKCIRPFSVQINGACSAADSGECAAGLSCNVAAKACVQAKLTNQDCSPTATTAADRCAYTGACRCDGTKYSCGPLMTEKCRGPLTNLLTPSLSSIFNPLTITTSNLCCALRSSDPAPWTPYADSVCAFSSASKTMGSALLVLVSFLASMLLLF